MQFQVGLGIVSLLYIWRPACDLSAEEWPLAAGLFGVQLGILMLLLSVWFAADFGFQWLFNAGYIASWRVHAASLNRQRLASPRGNTLMQLMPRRSVSGPVSSNI